MNTSNLECTICFERYNMAYKKPYLINPCGHTYCKTCLDNLSARKCPVCRGNIDSIIINRTVLDILEKPTALSDPSTIEIQKKLDILRSKQKDKRAEYKNKIENLKHKIQLDKTAKIQVLENDSVLLMKKLDDIEKKFKQECQKDFDEFSKKKQQVDTLVIRDADDVKEEIVAKINEMVEIQFSFDFKATPLNKQENLIGCIVESASVDITNSSLASIRLADIKKLEKYFFFINIYKYCYILSSYTETYYFLLSGI